MIIQITFSEVAIKPLNHNSIFAYAGKKFCSCAKAMKVVPPQTMLKS